MHATPAAGKSGIDPTSVARILVVEDDAIIAWTIERTLLDSGYEVVGVVTSGEEALEQVSALHPDLVLMDIGLSGELDGIETTVQLRRQFDVPVIYLTAYSDPITLERATLSQPAGYIGKPFDPQNLRATLELALYKHRIEAAVHSVSRFPDEDPNPVLRIGADGKILYANRSSAVLLAAWGTQTEAFIPEHCRPYLQAAIHTGLRQEVDVFCGEQVIACVWTPIQGTDYVNVYGYDITARKQLETALHDAEELQRLVLTNISDAVFITEKDGRFFYVCPNAREIFECTEQEVWDLENIDVLLGTSLFDRRAGIPEKDLVNIELDVTTPTGKLHSLLVNIRPVSIRQGRLLYTCRDITERKKVERAHQEYLAFMQSLLDTIPLPVFYKDMEGRYTGCNAAFEDFTGWEREKIIGKTVFDLWPAEIAVRYQEKDDELFRQPGTQIYRWVVQPLEGRCREVIFNKATIRGEAGQNLGLVGIILDFNNLQADQPFS